MHQKRLQIPDPSVRFRPAPPNKSTLSTIRKGGAFPCCYRIATDSRSSVAGDVRQDSACRAGSTLSEAGKGWIEEARKPELILTHSEAIEPGKRRGTGRRPGTLRVASCAFRRWMEEDRALLDQSKDSVFPPGLHPGRAWAQWSPTGPGKAQP